ncbi:unnamed protein product [Owenia fusiformis]|uniref:VPS9 domain-containing protein n=1 Tax=Owenia fusiformis TaxID=6347 RepID=A0A8S4NDZ2_OWEFU|nr:unnamed protein product [Owenia fusiformis]
MNINTAECMQQAMRLVSTALQFDSERKLKDAYVQYLQSVSYIVQLLLYQSSSQDFQTIMNPESKRFIKLGQECLDRIAGMFDKEGNMSSENIMVPKHVDVIVENKPGDDTSLKTIGSSLADPKDSTKTSLTPHPGLKDILTPITMPTPSIDIPLIKPVIETEPSQFEMPSTPTGLGLKPPIGASPMEIATQQNQLLMKAYQARMSKLNARDKKSSTLALTIQRKMSENIAIAQSRQQALDKKLQERQKRIEEQTARRFASTMGMSAEEQERRQLYAKILEYEQDTKWPLTWRERLIRKPDDDRLINAMIEQIFSSSDHPLTKLLNKYQYAIYDKIHPLVEKYVDKLAAVKVPYRETIETKKSDKKSNISMASQDDNCTGDEALSDLEKLASESVLESLEDAIGASKSQLESAIKRGSKLERKLTIENEDIERRIHGDAPALTSSKSDVEFDMHELDDIFDDSIDDIETPTTTHEVPIENNPRIDNDTKGSEIDAEQLQVLHKQSLERHLVNITNDVHTYLDKLSTMFIIAYESLDTAEGRDQCYASIEGPFFKPLWGYLLALYRVVNHEKEIAVAKSMTRHMPANPEDVKVKPFVCLRNTTFREMVPYEQAVLELQNIGDYWCPLDKLECIVRVSRKTLECIDEFYTKIGKPDESPVNIIGADDLLPVLSYITIKSGLPQLVSECQAMETFIHEGYLMGEEGYCLTTVQTALEYVAILD